MPKTQAALWVPPNARADFTKSSPGVPMGNQYGAWAGRDLSWLNLPGGSLMQFDLSRLSLQDFRGMRDNYQINMSLTVMSFMVHQANWKIVCDDKVLGKKIEDNIREIWTPLQRGLSQASWAGYSPMVIDWDNDGPSSTVKAKRIKDLVPEECWVNWKKVHGTPGTYSADDVFMDGLDQSGTVPPTFYEYNGIRQFPTPGLIDGMFGRNYSSPGAIPPDATMWYSLLMENGDYYGRKLLKAAFQPWYFSMLIHLFSNRYFERFGEPTPIGRADFDDTVTDENNNSISGREAMFNILENLRNRGVVVLPSDRVPWGDGSHSDYAYEIEYLESQMRGADFERYLTRLDEEMSLALFTPLLVSRTGDVGSQNLGVTHLQLYMWMLNALIADQKYCIDNYLIKPLVKFNGHAGSPPAFFVPRQLGKDNVETMRAVLTALVTQREARPDLNELGEALGLTLEETIALELPSGPPTADIPGTPGADGKPGPVTPGVQPTATKTVPFNPEHAPEVFDPVPGPVPRLPRNKVAVGLAPAPGKAKTTAMDTRGARVDRTVVKGINNKISARLHSQIIKAEKADLLGQVRFDIGYGNQMAQAIGPDEAALFFVRLDAFLDEVAPLGLSALEFGKAVDKLLDAELDRMVPA